LVGSFSRLANCVLGLSLAADEKDFFIFARNLCKEVRRFIKALNRFY
jgi:hypothetical protein